MAISVRSRAWRILRYLDRYTDIGEGLPEKVAEQWHPMARAGERLLGFYRNGHLPTDMDSLLFIAERGIYELEGSRAGHCFDYSELEGIQGPKEKLGAESLQLALRGGSSHQLKVRGGDEKIRDVYTVLRFLMRVTEDRAKTKASKPLP